jgi:HAD superfamily hydrolase (TIGR01549 family)
VSRTIDAVVFDLGETLVDETRSWTAWATWLGVRPITFFAALGAVIADRRQHTDVFEVLRPGFDLDAARAARDEEAPPPLLDSSDLHADAIDCLDRLRAGGYRTGIVGNQPAAVESMLAELHGRADLVGSSGSWGVEKPAPAFFQRISDELGVPPSAIAYVGDRIDNDIVPAVELGMIGVFLRRGPWGVIQATWPEAARASLRIDSLDELPAAFDALAGPSGVRPSPRSG